MSMRLATTPSCASCARVSLVERGEDPLQALAVELDDRGGQLLGAGRAPPDRRSASTCAVSSWTLPDERSSAEALERRHLAIPVGVCTTLRTLPLPYMCTPQGRHGSNEWTARMMSTPLKFSGPFSSKIGVFCTASS